MRIIFHKKFPFLYFKKKKKRIFPFVPDGNIGKCTYSFHDLVIGNVKETIIGSFCSIGIGVRIGNGIHPMGYLTSSPYLYSSRFKYKNADAISHEEWINDIPPVKIGHDVWIGDYAYIMNGVNVGTGAIIGAKAVVTKDVPPYAVVAGVPAKIIKKRFDDETILRLLRSEWWNLSDEIIKSLPYDDVGKCLEMIEEIRTESNDNSERER